MMEKAREGETGDRVAPATNAPRHDSMNRRASLIGIDPSSSSFKEVGETKLRGFCSENKVHARPS